MKNDLDTAIATEVNDATSSEFLKFTYHSINTK